MADCALEVANKMAMHDRHRLECYAIVGVSTWFVNAVSATRVNAAVDAVLWPLEDILCFAAVV
eukprot:SAG31_NODE_4444_length_3225_cov_2.086052_6_plen_63_part_00